MKQITRLKNGNLPFQIEDLAAIVTIVLVGGLALFSFEGSKLLHLALAGCILLFLAGCAIATRDPTPKISYQLRMFSLIVMLLSVFVLIMITDALFLAILLIIWVSLLPFYTKVNKAIGIMLVVNIAWFSLYQWRWDVESILITATLYGTFNIFAILMSYQALRANENAEKMQQLNQQLLATQHLLSEASKQQERTRIARDLHDLLGHHLTALIIKLQVAEYRAQYNAKQQIRECHDLSRLLLSDVRESVSAMRENTPLHFTESLQLLFEKVPRMSCHLDIPDDLQIDNIQLAQALLFCVQEALTNSLRHSYASAFWLTIEPQQGQLQISMHDNGRNMTVDNICKGNGLTGMEERIQPFGGELELAVKAQALHIVIRLPFPQ
ncbi:sensor histidine kinase [Neptunicella marina]|uniref:Sensor histidine kinase n=1 Tax=Neptunicella marina TaxID=2125989 RepID=A0A8J6M1A3_9ALTE|nr:sensor histidine kinase [Neptunicella marina]MBC3765277.1 sensor histidine kinase [Neptunicella marina]